MSDIENTKHLINNRIKPEYILVIELQLAWSVILLLLPLIDIQNGTYLHGVDAENMLLSEKTSKR